VQSQATAAKKALKRLKHQLGAFHPAGAAAAAAEASAADAAADAALAPAGTLSADSTEPSGGGSSSSDATEIHGGTAQTPGSQTGSEAQQALKAAARAALRLQGRPLALAGAAHADWLGSGWRAKVWELFCRFSFFLFLSSNVKNDYVFFFSLFLFPFLIFFFINSAS
jgi:hypothetical protein